MRECKLRERIKRHQTAWLENARQARVDSQKSYYQDVAYTLRSKAFIQKLFGVLHCEIVCTISVPLDVASAFLCHSLIHDIKLLVSCLLFLLLASTSLNYSKVFTLSAN